MHFVKLNWKLPLKAELSRCCLSPHTLIDPICSNQQQNGFNWSKLAQPIGLFKNDWVSPNETNLKRAHFSPVLTTFGQNRDEMSE